MTGISFRNMPQGHVRYGVTQNLVGEYVVWRGFTDFNADFEQKHLVLTFKAYEMDTAYMVANALAAEAAFVLERANSVDKVVKP